MTVDVDVVAGADDNRNGVACKHQTITISFYEEGKSLDEAGGMKLVSDQCIGLAVPEQFEIAEFMREFLDEIGLMSLDSATGALAGMYGGMKPADGEVGRERERRWVERLMQRQPKCSLIPTQTLPRRRAQARRRSRRL